MKKSAYPFLLCAGILFVASLAAKGLPGGETYDPNPPFSLDLLAPDRAKDEPPGKPPNAYQPKNPYNIFINYELGMHCVGFDISYCCIIPPYNSIQAQAVRSGLHGERPRLLTPDDRVTLSYQVQDNSYSEGNKMKYWQVLKDVRGQGTMNDPGDNMANYVWNHLYIYQDLQGTIPANPEKARRLYVGKEIPVNIDSGPSGKSVSGGYLDYAGKNGGNVVFTDSLMPEIKDVPLRLTSSLLWDALGLPLTAFNDRARKGSIRTITDRDYQPYQVAVVRLRDEKGISLMAGGKLIEFFGTEPVDISNCSLCHSGKGIAAEMSRGSGLFLFDKEYDYWKTHYPDVTEYIARLSATSIHILELHDRRHRTRFLADYNPDAASNRMGRVGSVNCVDCHGDNMSGNLQAPRPRATGYPAVRAKPLTEAVHSVHMRYIPMPDKAGRTQNCQACHPTHWQSEKMNDFETNPYQVIDQQGNPRFSDGDLRVSGGGCFLRRDAHANPEVSPPFFLNEIGKWYLKEVSLKDERGKPVAKIRGLYCTNCHNHLSHELYRYDNLRDAALQDGKTLRNRAIEEIIRAMAGGDKEKFKSYYADPAVETKGNPLFSYYAGHKGSILLRGVKDKEGRMAILPWNADRGKEVAYASVSAGDDWWFSPGEPHCADCHLAPFVESAGGKYFPIDQPGKYSLYRYSKAHGVLACQSCHESMHGLYPVRQEGPEQTVDFTSHQQALQFSPDNQYAGPVTCAACHTVNPKGVPAQLRQTEYEADYWAAVVLIHFMREGDQKMPVADLIRKYPYQKAKEIVVKGWK